MPGTAYVLYIDDNVAGPALELMRRVLQPASKSMPHITVLYIRAPYQDHGTRIYDSFVANRITLLRPGTFDPPTTRTNGVTTVYLQCESPPLEFLHHKPDYPDSFLHISLFDGNPSNAAATALEALSEFAWDLEVTLPYAQLTTDRRKAPPGGANLTSAAASLLFNLTNGGVGAADIPRLARSELGEVVRLTASHLHKALPSAPTRTRPEGTERSVVGRFTSQQQELWPAVQFLDPERAGHSRSPNGEANRRGAVFLTPPELAFDITRAALEWVDDTRPIDFGDPAIGSGVFLASLVNLIGSNQVQSAIGVESDPLRGHLTHDRWRSLGIDVVTGDFVEGMSEQSPATSNESSAFEGWQSSKRSLILANPPYIRSQRLDFETTSRWRRVIERARNVSIDHRSDLYVYFVLSAHDWLEDGGVGAWLLPTEFMFTNYGRALRDYLSRDVSLLAVHSYDGPSKFSNARVTSCAVIFRKSKPADGHFVRFSAGGILSDSYVESRVSQSKLRSAAKWHFLADEGIARSAPPLQTLGQLFDVRRGMATGSNQHFILSEESAQSMDAPREWLLPVVPRARFLQHSVIEADSNGNPTVKETRWLIDIDADWDEIFDRAPKLGTYLRAIEDDVRERTIVKRRRIFYKQERSHPSRFIFSYMARDNASGRRFFLNRSRAIILNNYLGLSPKPGVQAWLNESRSNEEILLDLLQKLEPSDFARAGRIYVEGLTKVEPRELAGIPFPPIPAALRDAVGREGSSD